MHKTSIVNLLNNTQQFDKMGMRTFNIMVKGSRLWRRIQIKFEMKAKRREKKSIL